MTPIWWLKSPAKPADIARKARSAALAASDGGNRTAINSERHRGAVRARLHR